ncbi:MAG TPA: DUF255 domain-containing protein [Candidatus Deferrimicrobium sp.]|nr:DUF255 domain-containing protein [Candidatus Deferrimicrobium sp.]
MTKHAHVLLPLAVSLFLAAGSVYPEESKKVTPKPSDQPTAATKSIQWQAYDTGLARAKAEKKHVFIDFTAKWCGWCKKMDKETFSQPAVVDMLNANFVPVRVDGDSEHELNVDGYKITEKDLARSEFAVTGYPSFWFLKPDGTKLAVIRGYRQTDYMMEALVYVKDAKYDTTDSKSSGPQGKPKGK